MCQELIILTPFPYPLRAPWSGGRRVSVQVMLLDMERELNEIFGQVTRMSRDGLEVLEDHFVFRLRILADKELPLLESGSDQKAIASHKMLYHTMPLLNRSDTALPCSAPFACGVSLVFVRSV